MAIVRGVQADGRTQTEGVRGFARAFRSRRHEHRLLRVVLGERVEEERKRGVKRSSRLGGEQRVARRRVRRGQTRSARVLFESPGLGVRQTRLVLGGGAFGGPLRDARDARDARHVRGGVVPVRKFLFGRGEALDGGGRPAEPSRRTFLRLTEPRRERRRRRSEIATASSLETSG